MNRKYPINVLQIWENISCHWQIYINLSQPTCFNLHIHCRPTQLFNQSKDWLSNIFCLSFIKYASQELRMDSFWKAYSPILRGQVQKKNLSLMLRLFRQKTIKRVNISTTTLECVPTREKCFVGQVFHFTFYAVKSDLFSING